ncbi:helix-turn-helix transcriptional regulator [Pseudorhodoferax sp.]|uniref:helix-turn-helix transcriptional regulator n=1 Tax=Pseudorhodoferax sp. TaxID=1993553 RepID=UPI002DD6ACCE|nr:LuxR C-terminal-related transcriptional regulator [Pseudorhodoferax sp.]
MPIQPLPRSTTPWLSELAQPLLASIRWPVILLGDALRVLAWNPAAERLASLEDALCIKNGHLHSRHKRSDLAMRQALQAVACGTPAAAPAPVMVRLPAAGQVLPLLLCFVALRPPGWPQPAGDGHAAMLLVQHPAQRPDIDPAMLELAFELTTAQARIAAALAQGQEPAGIAREQGVALSTVRKHVHAIYRKLGVGRVQDLMVLIGSSPWMAFGPPQHGFRLESSP